MSAAGRGGSDPRVAEAYDFCRRLTHRHGANFSVGFRFLPERKRDAVYAAYAFARRADDIADDPGDDAAGRLDEWERELEQCYAGRPGHPITVALTDSLRHFPIPKSAFAALIAGCRQDLVKSRYASFAELMVYCDYVATSISDISLSIFGYRSPEATAHGRHLSTALQLTNITRDVGDDLRRDRIYLPREDLDRFGVSEQELFERAHNPRVRSLIVFEAERALEQFRLARPLLHEIEPDSRFPVLMMGSVYGEVLRKVLRDPFAPLHRRVALPLPRKVYVVLRGLVRPRFA